MLKSISRSIKLINKDPFDTAFLKATMDNDLIIPKQKHVKVTYLHYKLLKQFILECISGKIIKYSVLEGYTRFSEFMLTINYHKCIKRLKVAYILHLALNVNQCISINVLQNQCNQFIDAISKNDVLSKVKQFQNSLHTDDAKVFLHYQIANNYFNYLHYYYSIYFSIQEPQNTLSYSKIVQLISQITKIYKELDLALLKFENNQLVRSITDLIIQDLKRFYIKVHEYISPLVCKLTNYQRQQGQKLYQIYSDILKINRQVKQFLSLDQSQDKLKLFQVDQSVNKNIELYYTNHVRKMNTESQIVSRRISQNDLIENNLHKKTNSKMETNQNIKNQDQNQNLQIDQKMFCSLQNMQQDQYENQISEFDSLEKKEDEQKEIESSQVNIQKQQDEEKNSKISKQEQFEPEPDQIKLVDIKQQSAPQRKMQFERKRTGNLSLKQIGQSQISTATQQSFIKTNDLVEMRILGIKQQNSFKKNNNHKPGGFFDHKDSPLDFIKVQNGDKSPQAY